MHVELCHILTVLSSNNFSHISDKRTVSPHRFPLLRSGSISNRPKTPNARRPMTPNSSRPTTPNASDAKRRVSKGYGLIC